MSDFLERFRPDPDFSDSRWTWETDKPVLRQAVVRFAAYDPTFHKSKPGRVYSLDPSCRTARFANDKVAVVIYSRDAEALQQRAWEYLMANKSTVELSLVKKLQSIQRRCVAEHGEEIEGSPSWRKHWADIQAEIPDAETAIDQFFKLAGISLASSGMDECAFVGFEFQSAWDLDHGLEIVMHQDRVLAAAGMTELMAPGTSVLEAVKAIQAYERDPDDFLVE